MRQKSVRYRKQQELIKDVTGPMPLADGLAKVKTMAAVAVDRSYKNGKKRKRAPQTVELVAHLGIDAKHADQAVRGSLSLPKGIGKSKRVIAFCGPDLAEAAKAAGAIEVGAEELVQKIVDGWMDFDVAVAHPQLMGKVGKLGRVLGPQGKMPSPKSGTVTPDVAQAVREYAAGKVEYRNDGGGNVHLPVGKTDFAVEDLQANVEAVLRELTRVRPSSAKGVYLKRVCVTATHTPSVTLQVG